MKILPNRGWLLVEVIKPERTTKSGLILTESIHEEPMYGKVLRIGNSTVKEGGVMLYPPQFGDRKVEVGDTIIFRARSQHELRETLGDNQLAFVEFQNILGIDLPEEEEK